MFLSFFAYSIGTFFGSPQESDQVPILSGLPENQEFDLGGGHALGFEQEALKILIPTSTSDQHFDIPVYGFHHSQWRFYPTVVQNPVQVIPEHPRQLFKRLHSLPTELISPGSQIPQHSALVGVRPEPIQAFLQ